MQNSISDGISVIVPVYNAENYLEACISSIINQTYTKLEIILVNDGSTDGSLDICKKYQNLDPRIKIVNQENLGQNAARYVGVQNASGEYIGFVDSDDWVEPDMYAHMLDYAIKNSLDMVCCGVYYEKGGETTERYNEASAGVYDYERIQQELLPWILASGTDTMHDRAILPHLVDKLIKRSTIEEALATMDKDIRWDEDTCTQIKCVLKSNRLGVLQECLYHYRIHNSSVCHKPDVRALESCPLFLKRMLEMSEYAPVLYNQIRYKSVNTISYMLRCGLNVELDKFYIFPYEDFKRGSSIALYGFGNVGKSFYKQLLATDGYFRRIDLFDSNPVQDEVHKPEELDPARYDRVVICVYDEKKAAAIRQDLIDILVPEDKIYWKEPVWIRDTFQFVF